MKPTLFLFILGLFFNRCCYAQWVQKANFPGSANRSMAVGFSIGNKGYLGTGSESTSCGLPIRCEKDFNDFWEYDPFSNSWTKKADFGGSTRIQAIGFSIGNKGYIGSGGRSDYKTDFWEYDPASNTWTRIADFPGLPRWASVGFSIGNKGYFGTGANGLRPFNDFWEYDPSSNTWSQKADFPGSARNGAVCFSIGSKGYIGTGWSEDDVKKDFWEYNPESNSWKQIADLPSTPRQSAIGFSVGLKGYVVSGHDGTYRKDFWEWDSTTNTWSQKPYFGGTGRIDAIGFSIGSKGYFGTGTDGIYRNAFWEYDTGIATHSKSNENAGLPEVFPNPAGNRITIEYEKEFNVELFDTEGRKVGNFSNNKTNLIIDLNNYHSGIYLLKIITQQKILVEKIIKR